MPHSPKHQSNTGLTKDENNLRLLEFVGNVPALLEMIFPILGPWTPKIVDESRLTGNQFRRAPIWPIDDGALHAALDEVEAPVGIIGSGAKLPWRDGVQRTNEHVRVVEG